MSILLNPSSLPEICISALDPISDLYASPGPVRDIDPHLLSAIGPEMSTPENLAEQLVLLPKEEQLERVMEILRKASANVDTGIEMAANAWDHLKSTELWKVSYPSLADFQVAVGWNEGVHEMVEGAKGREIVRAKTNYKLRSQWQCDLETLFDPAVRPTQYSRHFLESLSALVGLCSREEGLRKLFEARDIRRQQYRSRACLSLIPTDVGLAVKLVRAELENTQSRLAHDSSSDEDVRASSGQTRSSGRSSSSGDSQTCACSVHLLQRFSGEEWNGKVSIAEALATGQQWITVNEKYVLCRRHLRTLAGRGFGLYTNRTSRVLTHRTRTAISWATRSSLGRLRRAKVHWFRSSSSGAPDDSLGLWRWAPQLQEVFVFNAQEVFERYAGVGSWRTWLIDGNIVVPDFFQYLFTPDILRLIDCEFDAYKYHTKLNFHGKARNGWTRTMFYSLIQQLVRQDPAYYAIIAAARPDQNWRLISYPYYTKDTALGESTGFKHLDLNVPALLNNGRGANIIQTSLSLDHEDPDGCTILVPGFHRHIREWWGRVEARGTAADGLTTNVNQRYRKEDEESFGSFVPFPCQRGGVRISRPELIHGSTSVSTKRRRTVFVWHCGIGEDHVKLDNEESETWDEVAKCHRDMDIPRKSTSGHGFAYGKPSCRFPASTRLGSTSAIGDAMVGLRRWDEPCVILERNIVLGPDDAKALAYINKTRTNLLQEYCIAFDIMVEAEKAAFGRNSFFADPERARLRAAQEPDSDDDRSEFGTDSGSELESDGGSSLGSDDE